MVNVILGTSKNDKLVGTSNDDAIYGLSGDDTVDGGNGNDVISGGAASSAADADYLGVKQAFKGEVTVDIPKTSSLNPVGMYKIDAAGNISGVTILWGGTIPGLGGLGNQTISKTLAVDLKAGERYGFFILSSGYVSATTATLLNDTKAKWEMRDGDGQSGQITDSNLRLCYVDPLTGLAVPISVGAGHDIYHSVGGAANGYKPNPDGKQHAQTTIDIAQGVVTIGLESGKGNNPDFKDATIKFSMGIDNVLPFGEADPNGNGGNDVLNGGEGDDKVLGMAGNDVLSGGNGQDRLWGNTGNDTLSGDGGDDWLSGGIGNDVIKGGQGQDKLLGQTGNDNLNGEDGDDYVSGDDGDDTMAGGNNNDTLYGGKGNDKLAGDAGDDKLHGDTGNDDISGGDGHDQIKGGDGNDTVSGNNGDDTVSAGKGDDVVQGGAGNDNLKGDTGRDTVSGNESNDVISTGDGNDVVSGGDGNDTLSGGKGNDALRDDAGNDQVKGDSGDDVIVAGSGDDVYDGGSGKDTVDFSENVLGVTVDLEAHTATGAGNDKITSVENVTGTASADTLIGDKASNTLSGGGGGDILSGARGSDVLIGGGGEDIFVWNSRKDATGETGSDKFVDVVKDYSAGDVLDFSGFGLDIGGGVTAAVTVAEVAGSTQVFADFGSAGIVHVVTLEGITGFDVALHYADGTLLV